jgi:hypothetical protein
MAIRGTELMSSRELEAVRSFVDRVNARFDAAGWLGFPAAMEAELKALEEKGSECPECPHDTGIHGPLGCSHGYPFDTCTCKAWRPEWDPRLTPAARTTLPTHSGLGSGNDGH